MGKAAQRRKIAARRNEKPNDYNDRVKLAVKKGDDNLSAMYVWHEARMEEAKEKFEGELSRRRAEHDEEFDKMKLDLKKVNIRLELKLQKSKNDKKKP